MGGKMSWWRWGCVLGLLVAGSTGCHSYSPYGPGPYGPGPYGRYPIPGGGPAYVGPNGYPPGTVVSPNSALPSALPWNGNEVPKTNNSASGTGAVGNVPAASENSGGKLVPNYADPAGAGGARSGNKGATLGAPDDGADNFRDGNSYNGPRNSLTSEQDEIQTALGNDQFTEPIRLVNSTTPPAEFGLSNQGGKLNPYKFDRQHRWLRGVVTLVDDQWCITYSVNPEERDDYDGRLTLTPHNDLEVLRQNDVVLVKGMVDDNLRDRNGKPMYRVLEAKPLKPKGT